MRKESREREKKDKEIIGSHYFKVFKTRNTAIKNIFLVMSILIKQSQKARSKSTTQEKIQIELYENQNFCFAKDTVKRMKRQVTDWEKIVTKPLSVKKLVSKIYKELLKFSKKKISNNFL